MTSAFEQRGDQSLKFEYGKEDVSSIVIKLLKFSKRCSFWNFNVTFKRNKEGKIPTCENKTVTYIITSNALPQLPRNNTDFIKNVFMHHEVFLG